MPSLSEHSLYKLIAAILAYAEHDIQHGDMQHGDMQHGDMLQYDL